MKANIKIRGTALVSIAVMIMSILGLFFKPGVCRCSARETTAKCGQNYICR